MFVVIVITKVLLVAIGNRIGENTYTAGNGNGSSSRGHTGSNNNIRCSYYSQY